MKKAVFFAVSDTFEIGKEFFRTRLLPKYISADEIEDACFSQNNSNEQRVGPFDTEEEAAAAADKMIISTERISSAVPFFRCDVAYVEEDDAEEDEDGDVSYDYIGIDHFRCGAIENVDDYWDMDLDELQKAQRNLDTWDYDLLEALCDKAGLRSRVWDEYEDIDAVGTALVNLGYKLLKE